LQKDIRRFPNSWSASPAKRVATVWIRCACAPRHRI